MSWMGFCLAFVLPVAAAVAQANSVVSITNDNYQREVIESKTPVVMMAYASWCGYCKMTEPVLEELSRDLKGSVKFARVNVDTESALASQLQIRAMPTLFFYKNGKLVDRRQGALGKDDLLAVCKQDFQLK